MISVQQLLLLNIQNYWCQETAFLALCLHPPAKADALFALPRIWKEGRRQWPPVDVTKHWVLGDTNPVEVQVKYEELRSSLPASHPESDVTSCRTLITPSLPLAPGINSALMKCCCLFALPLLIPVYWQQSPSETEHVD